MKKIGLATMLMVMAVLMMGCITTGTGTYRIPPPTAGLTLFVNQNEAVEAHCWLFQGSNWGHGGYGYNSMLTTNPKTGRAMFANPPIASFVIPPSFAQNFWRVKPVQLVPVSTDYSLFVVWSRVTGRVVGVSTLSFSTTGYPFACRHVDPLGRVTFADSIVYLPWMDPTYTTQLRIDKILYPGEWLKDLVGLP